MSVQARFFVAEITRTAHGHGQQVKLNPVSRGPENKTWASATPTGQIMLGIGNPDAVEWFASRLGSEVAITFEDRPIICALCHGEIDSAGQYQADVVDSKGNPVHRDLQDCSLT